MVFLSLLFLSLAPDEAAAGKNLIKNGGLERADQSEDPKPGKTADWTGYVWEGQGQIKRVKTAAVGRYAMMIEGSGPAKQAIFQGLKLPACHYRLRALVAGKNLSPNHWKQSAAVYISFESGGQVFRDIFTGDSDWREMELNFEVKTKTKLHVYFFNYGSGSFFVDHIRLTRRQGCKAGKTFTLARKAKAKLNYTLPLQGADLALRGYCSNKVFARRTVCKALKRVKGLRPRKKPGASRHLIADFAGHQPFETGGLRLVSAANGKMAGRIVPGNYMIATPEQGLPSRWDGYDWLNFQIQNPSRKTQKMDVEIHDNKSDGYWSRVNYYTMAPPGLSHHRIPLQIFVGEKSVIQERRRLDLRQIKKLVFSARGANTSLDISNVHLEREEPYKNDFPQLLKLDAGPSSGPLFYGFTPLHPGHGYRARRGYGFARGSVVARSEDRRHPGGLLRDWISMSKGGLDIDLPNGNYHVWMMLEDPGYWEYYPNFTSRKVLAEGRVVLNETQNAATFQKKFYRHANVEDLPGDDIWNRYIRTRYKPVRFKILVRDGQLNLRFLANKNPYALALSALILYPHEQKGRGEAFVKEAWARQKQHFEREYRQIMPPKPPYPEAAANFLDKRLSLFTRSATLDVFPGDYAKQSEQITKLSLSLARGETAPLTISLRAKQKLQLVDVRLDVPGIKTSSYKVRSKVTRQTEDGSVYRNAPRLLDPLHVSMRRPLVLQKNETRRLWFDVTAPAKMKRTGVSGKLVLKFKNGERLAVDVNVKIHPWRLPKLDIIAGYLGIAPNYPQTPWREMQQKKRQEMRAAVSLLKKHGLNLFSGGLGGPVFKGYDKGRMQVDFGKIDEGMKMLRGQKLIESYLGAAIEDLKVYQPDEWAAKEYGKAYPLILRDMLGAIKRRSAQKGWPAIRHVVGDEPDGEEAINQSLAAARAFRAGGGKTSVFTSISDMSKHANRLKFAGLIDMVYLNFHSKAAIKALRKKGSQCALYNRRNRYQRGIYLMKMRQIGCRGHMQFAFNSTHVDHWYDLDGREDDQVAVFTHPDGVLRPALDLKRYAMAITDYRYLLKLRQVLKKSAHKDAKASAGKWLNDLLKKMKVGQGHEAVWTAARLDYIRQKSAHYISALQ